MKKNILSLIILLFSIVSAVASPAYPELTNLINPDGTSVKGYIVGDEHFHFCVDVDRKFILEQNKSGVWTYAVREGRKLQLNNSDINTLRAESLKRINKPKANSRPKKMGILNDEGRTTYPTVGDEEIHSLVVLIQYADTKFSVPDIRQAIDDLCNQPGYSQYDAKGSARDYYNASSFGKFKPVFDVMEPVTLSQTSKHYVGSGNGSSFDYFGEAIYESLTQLHDSGKVDFSKYDYDNNGIVDNVYFFFAGYGQADTGRTDCIWPHQADYKIFMDAYGLPELIFDGKRIASYACSAELKGTVPQINQPYLAGIGTFCHEYGHVLGLPDLYDTIGGSTESPGYWDIMAYGSYNDKSTCPPIFSAYERWLCNWVEPEIAEDGILYTLPAATSQEAKSVIIKCPHPVGGAHNTSEFFILECRAKDSWDKSLEDNGLLIWHINYDPILWENNTPNTRNTPHIQIHKPDKKLTVWPGEDGQYNMTYPGMNNGLCPSSSNDKDYKIFLNDIEFSKTDQVARFVYNKLSDYPIDVVRLNPQPELIEDTRRIVLSWNSSEKGEKDDEYWVTVKRLGNDGKEFIVDNFDEKSVGSSTNVTIGNISPSAWKQDFEAYVRIVRYGIPAQTISNVITFNPSKVASVDETKENESPIFNVFDNTLTLPSASEIFSLTGRRINLAESLSPGIYLIRTGDRSRKIAISKDTSIIYQRK